MIRLLIIECFIFALTSLILHLAAFAQDLFMLSDAANVARMRLFTLFLHHEKLAY